MKGELTMSRQFKATLNYLFTDLRYTLTSFWIILLAIVVLLVSIQLIFNQGSNEITLSISVPIIIFAGVVGYLTVKNGIPYIVRLGATRKCVFLCVLIFFICLTLFNALFAFLINQF